MDEFDYYSSAPSVRDLARWFVFLRLFCVVRARACAYSNIATPSSTRVFRSACVVPIPDYVLGALCDHAESRHANYLDLSMSQDEILSADPGIHDWFYGGPDDEYRPRRTDAYSVTASTPVLLGRDLVRCASSVLAKPADSGSVSTEVALAVAGLVNVVSLGPVQPAPLRQSEVSWIESVVGRCAAPMLGRQ